MTELEVLDKEEKEKHIEDNRHRRVSKILFSMLLPFILMVVGIIMVYNNRETGLILIIIGCFVVLGLMIALVLVDKTFLIIDD
ncbi:MAG: hypothetical protein V1829_00695 [bacterium]